MKEEYEKIYAQQGYEEIYTKAKEHSVRAEIISKLIETFTPEEIMVIKKFLVQSS